MLAGYVSDERYVALPDVLLEFENSQGSVEARSRATGAVYADVSPGPYKVTLYRQGYGSKSVRMTVREGEPYQFRLLKDSLLGYMWPKWVRSGERAQFRVHAVEAYKLELWRYGWQKEYIRPIGWYDEHGPRATMQITPDGDYTQTGVQWNKRGYGNPQQAQLVAGPERSGLYYMHAKTESGVFFSFPWVVAPAKPQAELAVLASNITWNAYNNFGGRSNYINPDRLPPTPTVNARLDLQRYIDPDSGNYISETYLPLSFERPESINFVPEDEQVTDPIEGRSACHIAPAEWRLLGWLEREGFAYDYYAETQFHSGLLNLDDYKALIISTHPEYWSKEMYHKLKSWVFERGGKLMYLGGNGLNCEVEFVDEYTTIFQNGPHGGQAQLEKLGFESRFHQRVESEANLLGVVYTETGVMTSAPYRVVDAGHWIFAGTGLKDGDIFGEKSLHMRVPGGASGHETDKISASSPKNVQLVAKGLNVDNGGAEIVYHEPGNGGAVFSVGSISYPSSILVDDAVSQITANVLNRFLGK
ncbi:MAG: carboxypeptidase regulatory-like domain-containing protein [Chloroflexi bacterium]|nr:carboxypeptidase regulatory-like domain-containing protein [Chloroflexota bacterium]